MLVCLHIIRHPYPFSALAQPRRSLRCLGFFPPTPSNSMFSPTPSSSSASQILLAASPSAPLALARYAVIKTGIELGNIGAFVVLIRAPVADYQEGFWCAVVSLIVSGAIAFIVGYNCECSSESHCPPANS
jgi:hypothetical protein